MIIVNQETPTEKKPTVSIIILTLNRIAKLEEALATVVSQDYKGVAEVIVVDDCSASFERW